jgi:hypothetical protein
LLSDVDPVKVKGRIFRIGEARYRVLSSLVSRGKKRGYIGVQVDSKGTRTGGPRYFIAIGTPVRLARVKRLDDDSVRVERKRNATRTSRRINSGGGFAEAEGGDVLKENGPGDLESAYAAQIDSDRDGIAAINDLDEIYEDDAYQTMGQEDSALIYEDATEDD